MNSAKAFEKSVQAYADAFYRAHEEDIRNHVLAHLEKTKKKDVDDYIHEHLKSKTIVHVKLMTAQSYLKEHPNDAPDFLREIAAHE